MAQKKQTKKPPKQTAQKVRKTSEFRFPKVRPGDKTPNHPHYVYRKQGKEMTMLEITHDKSGSNRSKSRPLEKNPNPKDTQKARVMRKAIVKNERDMGERLKGWKFQTKNDRETVNKIITENNKKRKGG